MVIAPNDLSQGDTDNPTAIMAWGYLYGNGIFWLVQYRDRLQLVMSRGHGVKERSVFEMATLPDTGPHHVIISWTEMRLACYLDGKKVKEIDPSPDHLVFFTPPLRFASHNIREASCWRGKFDHVAMYSRFIEEDEAAKNAALVAAEMAKRQALPQIEVQATLVAFCRQGSTASKWPRPWR
jgi:hypothetical protein